MSETFSQAVFKGGFPCGYESLAILRSFHYSDRLHGAVSILPEGVAGVFKGANRSREQIYLGPRKGFIKVAVVAGVGMLPACALIQFCMPLLALWVPAEVGRQKILAQAKITASEPRKDDLLKSQLMIFKL